MDAQTEYLIRRNQIPRGQVTRRLFVLGVFLILGYIAIWYYWPTSTLANLPYCVTNFFPEKPSAHDQQNTLNGVYISPRTGPRMDNFDLPWIHLLRFNSDGRVLYTFEIYNGQIDWREISKRFNWKTIDSRVLSGRYDIADGHIHIALGRQPDNYLFEWEGVLVDGNLLFESNDQLIIGAFADTNILTFTWYDVEQCPFARR